MDTLLPELLAFPPKPLPATPLTDTEYDIQIKGVLKLLNQLPVKRLIGDVAGGGNLLNILDPSVNTLPYLYALHAHIHDTNTKQASTTTSEAFSPTSSLWRKIVDFLERFDMVQIRYAGSEFGRLIEIVAKTAKSACMPQAAILPIRTAILRLDPSSACFTSNHLLFVRLCLEAREYRAALPILGKDIFYFPSPAIIELVHINPPFPCSPHEFSSTFITMTSHLSAKLGYTHHLQYFIFGAMIYMKLKHWERALHFLEIVITCPTANTASMIQVEAYKKWILVNLVAYGIVPTVPRTINIMGARVIMALTKEYEALWQIFQEGISRESNADRLLAEVDAGKNIWRDDCNTGLVWQVIDAFRRFSILKLEKTYVALYIRDIARRTSPDPANYPETAEYIRSLIASGRLDATLVESLEGAETAVLRFSTLSHPGPQIRTEAQLLEKLRAQTDRIGNLNGHVREIDRRLGLSKEYIDSANNMQRSKDTGGYLGFNSAMPMNDDYVADEDMMADL